MVLRSIKGLVERYGCVSGYPDGLFKGGRTLSRDEFASGISSCSDEIEILLKQNAAVLREDIEK